MSSFSGETSLILGPALCAGQHSQLEQERQYLHQALVAERGRKEWLLGALKKAEAELVPTDQSKPLADTSGPCKKVTSFRSELNSCAQTEQSLYDNLASVLLRMQRLEQDQWRRYQNYTQRSQFAAANPPVAPNWPAVMYNWPEEGSGPQLYTRPASAHGVYGLYDPIDQSMVDQIPSRPTLRPLRFDLPVHERMNPADFAPGHILQVYDEDESRNRLDSISTYTLSPRETAHPNTFPLTAVPTTQSAELVGGFKNLPISSREQEPNTYMQGTQDEALVHGQGPSSLTHRLGLLNAHSSALRLERKAKNWKIPR